MRGGSLKPGAPGRRFFCTSLHKDAHHQSGNSRFCSFHRRKNIFFFALTREKTKKKQKHKNTPQKHQKTPKNTKKHQKTPKKVFPRLRAEKKRLKKAFALTRDKIIFCLAELNSAKNVGIFSLQQFPMSPRKVPCPGVFPGFWFCVAFAECPSVARDLGRPTSVSTNPNPQTSPSPALGPSHTPGAL